MTQVAARFLLDTNIWIYLRRRRPVAVTQRFDELAVGEAVMSVITYGELYVGAAKSRDPRTAAAMLGAIVESVPVLSMPASAGRIYGEVRAGLERSGSIIGNNDIWIAAHALAANLTLVTNNVREFQRVPGLQIDNWAAEGE